MNSNLISVTIYSNIHTTRSMGSLKRRLNLFVKYLEISDRQNLKTPSIYLLNSLRYSASETVLVCLWFVWVHGFFDVVEINVPKGVQSHWRIVEKFHGFTSKTFPETPSSLPKAFTSCLLWIHKAVRFKKKIYTI